MFSPFRLISLFSVAGLLYFFCGMISLHFLDHEFDPTHHFLSEYAGGRYGWISQSAFWLLFASFTLVSLGLIIKMNEVLFAWLPFLLFCIAVVGLGVLTAHPINWAQPHASEQVDMHNQAAWTGFISIIAGQVLWSLAFYFHPVWRSYALPLLLLSSTTLSYFLLQGIQDLNHMDTALLGLHQRVLVALIWSWMFICALLFSRKQEEVFEAQWLD